MPRLMIRALAPFCALALSATTVQPAARATPPDPSALLLAPADTPPGYIADAALENAEATARTLAYSNLIVSSSFAGYRARDGAIVHYVALLRDRADAALVVAREGLAVDSARQTARLTLDRRYGDGAGSMVAYQQRGARGEEWALAVFAVGRYVTALGAYSATGEQTAINLLQHLAAAAEMRLKAAAARAPDPAPMAARTKPALRITALLTTTRAGRPQDHFSPHSALYWRVVWHIERAPRGARETVRASVWRGKTILYHTSLTDAPYAGDNMASDHPRLSNLAAGRYALTVTVTIGRLSATAAHVFYVVAPPAVHGQKTPAPKP